MSKDVEQILNDCESENPRVKTNFICVLMHEKLDGTSKLVILPIDQGFEHGLIKSFEFNPEACDPRYQFQLAVNSEVSAYYVPLVMIEAGASIYAGILPLVLKFKSINSLYSKILTSNQTIKTAPLKDALHLHCAAVRFTIYPVSVKSFDMMEEACEIKSEVKCCGFAVVLWPYPRREGISKEGETLVDVIPYAAHITTLLGANTVKVKLPTNYLEKENIQ